jgi:hypothetical protein
MEGFMSASTGTAMAPAFEAGDDVRASAGEAGRSAK